ncbi:serine hydrolase domain-containing protein [Chitinophaga rhizophila]|uniref:Beta-lactamase family protein n=1 Tax=Chitinophaga rhizophila TaxID=2866212 RepID=A0ABS7G9C7_9BACT|nr:serine hydrolase [Chitinophaga rhizophila]MBW8683312.1 beta-lactamase family protein [Chitinophaga rhizophila]
MRIRKIIYITGISLVVVLLAVIIYVGNSTFPIISGYAAKIMCSEVFIGGRQPDRVTAQDLSAFPLSLARCSVDYKDSSVTASVFGFSGRKALYRKGVGATLISELAEDVIRRQSFAIPPPDTINMSTVAWPMGDKVADTIPANVDNQQLNEAIDFLFTEQDSSRRKLTRAVVVVYRGQIIAERYAPGFSQHSMLLGWSMAKSVTGALAGLLAQNGQLDVDAPVPVSDWQQPTDKRHAITTKDLLQQCSGLRFDEDYSKRSDVTSMLYLKSCMGCFAADHSLDTVPGTRFRYTSGNTNIVSQIIRNVVGEQDYHAFPYKALFYKLGMYHSLWEPDASGTYVGSSYIYASARDWARFALLYLNKGRFNNEQILSENWVKQTISPGPAANFDRYGYTFWLNTGKQKGDGHRTFQDAPDDMFYADGFQGQNIFIIPSKDLAVIRLGMTLRGGYRANRTLQLILAAIH